MKEIIKYTDINLDWIPHPLTGNIKQKTNIDAIQQAIKILLSLNIYDIPFQTHIMSNIHSYLFEPITPITISNIRKRIEWVLKTYEKRIKLIDIEIKPFHTDNGIDITITYKIKALDIIDVFNYVFQRVR